MNPSSNESIPQARLQDRVDTNRIKLDNFPNCEANISVSPMKYNMGVSSRDDNVSPPSFNPNCIHISTRQLPTDDNHEFVDELLPFTLKLHACLNDAQFEGFEHIISWQNETLFKVHDVDAFSKLIMPRYFKSQTRYRSFQRQLNLYEFERITSGIFKGAYGHLLFHRGRRELCNKMKLIKIKGKKDSSSSPTSTPTKSDDGETGSEQPRQQPHRPQRLDRQREGSFEGRKFFPI
jgi:hypothetical protein